MSKIEELYNKLLIQTKQKKINWEKTSAGGFLYALHTGSVKLERDAIMKTYALKLYDNDGVFLSGVNGLHNAIWNEKLDKLYEAINNIEQERINKKIDDFLSELE